MSIRILTILCLTTIFLLQGCASAKFPAALDKKVDFNMSLDYFNLLKGTSTADMQDDSFRWVYNEEVNDDKLSNIVYYFDKDGSRPLYEMIFIYKDKNVRNKEANELLGYPNNDGEWRLEKAPYTIIAWNFESKLVMAALIPNTEWWEEEN